MLAVSAALLLCPACRPVLLCPHPTAFRDVAEEDEG